MRCSLLPPINLDGIVHAFYSVSVAIQTKPYRVQGLIEISVRCRQVCRLRIRVDVGEMPRI